jgi:hypothetical protein
LLQLPKVQTKTASASKNYSISSQTQGEEHMTNEFNPDWMCVCGDLTALGVVHRKDGPCYIPEPKREWGGLDETDLASVSGVEVEWARHWEKVLKGKNT